MSEPRSKAPRVEWVEADRPGDDHGVEFHCAGGNVRRCVAFVVGYEWLHGTPEVVRVEILPAAVLHDLSISRQEVEEAVEAFFLAPHPPFTHGAFSVYFNA